VLAHREQFHQSRLVELVTPSGIQYQTTLQQIVHYFMSHGSSLDRTNDPVAGFAARLSHVAKSASALARAFLATVLEFEAMVFRLLARRKVVGIHGDWKAEVRPPVSLSRLC